MSFPGKIANSDHTRSEVAFLPLSRGQKHHEKREKNIQMKHIHLKGITFFASSLSWRCESFVISRDLGRFAECQALMSTVAPSLVKRMSGLLFFLHKSSFAFRLLFLCLFRCAVCSFGFAGRRMKKIDKSIVNECNRLFILDSTQTFPSTVNSFNQVLPLFPPTPD